MLHSAHTIKFMKDHTNAKTRIKTDLSGNSSGPYENK